MNTKYLFFDIDGTLAMPGYKASPETISALKTAQKNGHKIFLNTGRSEKDVPDHILSIGFDGAVYSAGGRIIVNDEVIFNQFFNPDDVKRILSFLETLDVQYILECADHNFTNKNVKLNLEELDPDKVSSEMLRAAEMDMQKADVRAPLLMDQYKGEPVYKINFRIPGEKAEEIKEKLLSEFNEQFLVCFFDNLFPEITYTIGEIEDLNINKGFGVDKVCEYFGADISDSIAFGDSLNDAAMIKEAGLGVVMGNSASEMKAMADVVCESCDDNGIANEMRRLGLLTDKS